MSDRPPQSRASAARKAAAELGGIVRARRAFAQDVIASHIDAAKLPPAEKAFATRLILGVTSSQGTLDEILDRHIKNPEQIQPEIRDALRVSTYEIIFLGKDPHAAVHQGVELVKGVNRKASGLANAVLRKVVADRETFPFGDPSTDRGALSRLYAFPQWLTELLVRDKGFSAARLLMAASNEPAPLFIAVNHLKAAPADIASVLRTHAIEFSAVVVAGVAVEGCFRMADRQACLAKPVRSLIAQGKILICDAASQAVVEAIMPPRFPERFLEVGSGRGNKTILLQSEAMARYGKQMSLTSLDRHDFKMKILSDRLRAYGVSYKELRTHDARRMGDIFEPSSFDAVFIDAPCSGLGTLRRHPEIRWRITPQVIEATAELGLSLLANAARLVEVGGYLSYATCTVLSRENEGVIERFLSSTEGRGFALDPLGERGYFSTELTVGSPDAHFASRLVRRS